MEEKATWRGPYAECDTFDLCDKFSMPEWINLLLPPISARPALRVHLRYKSTPGILLDKPLVARLATH